MKKSTALPKLGFIYLDHVLRFFDRSNFKGWPDKIESVVYHWGNDKQRFINEVKRKKIEVLIGNIPATAYETFRDIARELPHVKFVPSLDAQFANKSKENVTHFCQKYNLPIPKTDIFYEAEEAMAFLSKTSYPKIIKKSYGPSNYGGYYVHKVDSYKEAKDLLSHKKYYPVYVQEFVPMAADIRVMLVGHRPICAFWRRPPEGEWLTNTSQGGSMDYINVPQKALDIAVKASKAANAEYWACDIALGVDGKFRILECATAFAAFPYVRDWIGQYLMWSLSNGQFKKPYIPLFNWEELGKIRSSLLRTMRHITFGEYTPSYDTGDALALTEIWALLPTELRGQEEWPSEHWNFQDNYIPRATGEQVVLSQEAGEIVELGLEDVGKSDDEFPELSETELVEFFTSVKGIGAVMANNIVSTLGAKQCVEALVKDPLPLLSVKNVKEKKLEAILLAWQDKMQTTA